jgi:hypothetical protein
MRRYTLDEERRLRLQSAVIDWTRSGLLDDAQKIGLLADLSVDLNRTGRMLRAGIALFTAVVASATVSLVFIQFSPQREWTMALFAALTAVGLAAAADFFVARLRVYRYGVEEMLAAGAAGALAASAALAVAAILGDSHVKTIIVAALLAGAAGAIAAYVRFGFRYASVAALVLVALVPFVPPMPPPARHALAWLACVLTFLWAGARRRRYGDDVPGDEAASLEAWAFVGAYLCANLYILPAAFGIYGSTVVARWFTWSTYGGIWLMPLAGLWLALRARLRHLLDAALVTLVATLVTNKLYLGWPAHPWDPILLGLILMGAALATRRWLAAGPDGSRRGVTGVRLVESDAEAVRLVSLASAGLQPPSAAPSASEPSPSAFAGGRSGGGGAGADF